MDSLAIRALSLAKWFLLLVFLLVCFAVEPDRTLYVRLELIVAPICLTLVPSAIVTALGMCPVYAVVTSTG
jgi:hypothetical protein